MAAQNEEMFDGETGFVDVHDVLQTKAGNATWLNEFSAVIEGPKNISLKFCYGCLTH